MSYPSPANLPGICYSALAELAIPRSGSAAVATSLWPGEFGQAYRFFRHQLRSTADRRPDRPQLCSQLCGHTLLASGTISEAV